MIFSNNFCLIQNKTLIIQLYDKFVKRIWTVIFAYVPIFNIFSNITDMFSDNVMQTVEILFTKKCQLSRLKIYGHIFGTYSLTDPIKETDNFPLFQVNKKWRLFNEIIQYKVYEKMNYIFLRNEILINKRTGDNFALFKVNIK